MGSRDSIPRGKAQEREARHSPPSSAEVKKTGAIISLPHVPSRHSAYLIKHGDNFTVTFYDGVTTLTKSSFQNHKLKALNSVQNENDVEEYYPLGYNTV
jgi:hypothetical protein